MAVWLAVVLAATLVSALLQAPFVAYVVLSFILVLAAVTGTKAR